MDNGGATVMEMEIVTIVDSMPVLTVLDHNIQVFEWVRFSPSTYGIWLWRRRPHPFLWMDSKWYSRQFYRYLCGGRRDVNLGDTITCTTTAMDVSNQVVTDSVDVVVQHGAFRMFRFRLPVQY